jgi:hypothetical protein
MKPSTIAFIGDLHLSFTIWESRREITGDSDLGLSEILKVCKSRDIRDLILPGDIFDSPDPHPALVYKFRDFVERASEQGTSVSFIQGNHDKRVLSWGQAVSGDAHWIGDGQLREIAGTAVRAFDYTSRDDLAAKLAEVESNGVPSDVIVMHQACKQYLDIEGCWSLDLDWVPELAGDIVMSDIHEPWGGPRSGRWAGYTGAMTTRSINEARHPKSVLLRHPGGVFERVPILSRAITQFAVTADNIEGLMPSIRDFIAYAGSIQDLTRLPGVIYVTYDNSIVSAPEIIADTIKAAKSDVFVVPKFTGSQKAAITFDPSVAAEGVPEITTFVSGFLKPEDDPRAHGLALDLLDGTQGKEGIVAQMESARQRFLQEVQ